MRYIAQVDDRTYNVDIDESGEALQVQVDGQPVTADLRQVTAPSLFSLIKDGVSYEIFAEPTEKGYAMVISGERFVVDGAANIKTQIDSCSTAR